ncbi:hypothetical protein GCM10010909_36580 [Acidocella aquatica]|uniref:DUF302 domain-containing protein n=1 Tax=Acidocella aquatica TaxID=1922313 RepID=A0ABQ6A9V4_9PROT|nr:DUF302 domain-containing protein [Acidocella aquatica]GLR68976.1 hypothetical protein GCM10010909_36580 [Acidocella aquatica]
MTYHFSATVRLPFEKAVETTKAALKQHGFGVLSEIDVQATMKEKLGADFRPYRILGACNPQMAYQALQAEDKIGTMLPCNVIVQEQAGGMIEISAVDPVASMQAIDNPALAGIAQTVGEKLRAVIGTIDAMARH